MNLNYDRVVCINLDRRPEAWQKFQEGLPADFPFGEVERYAAIDGKKVPCPDWWRGGAGAWGCFLSHKRIIEECLNAGLKSVLIFEDDALFCDNFAEKVKLFHEHLPSDAQWVYYGGQHLKRAVQRPERVNEWVYTPYNVNRTHAYGLIGTEALKAVEKHLNRKDWTTANHIDHHFGRMHQKRELKVYCPAQWLVDQREGRSDVAGRDKAFVHWADAADVPDASMEPFFAVLGCHSSGSSALAGVLYNLGVHLGNTLTGMYGQPPIRGGEALDLQRLFEQAAPVPSTDWKISREAIKRRLTNFVNRRRQEAKMNLTVAAGKYPQMGAAGDILHEILGEKLRLIICQRPIEQSIDSLVRRFSKLEKNAVAAHQRWIAEGIESVRKLVDAEKQFVVNYEDLLERPTEVINNLILFMGIKTTSKQFRNAVRYVRPELRHFG